MRLHFRDRHIKDIIQIREEGLQPLPQCQKCGIFQNNVGLRHQQTVSCKKYTMRLALQNANEHNKKVAAEVKFTICGEIMEQVKEFRYLGRVVSENDNDDKAIIQNLQKTKSTWGVLHRLLRKESKRNIKVIVGIYQCIIQTRLLYGSETWVISRQLLKMMETFHKRCLRCLAGDFIRKVSDDEWIYPSTVEVMKKTGLKSIKEYINERRKQVEKHLFVGSTPMTNIMESLNIDVSMERVIWWKPFPIPNNTT